MIESGWFKALNLSLNGDEQIMRFYRPGELLGLEAVSAPRYICTAVALERARVHTLSIPAFHELCGHSPNLYRTILELITKYIDEMHGHMLMLGQKTASERLARFIYDVFSRTGKSEVMLSMPREAIGSYLGIALETVSRLLHQFEREDLIRLRRRRVRLLDRRRLYQLAYDSDSQAPPMATHDRSED